MLLFSGSIFFWSEYNSLDQLNQDAITLYGLIYSSVFIDLGFLMMLAIFIYHIYMRFPRLQELTQQHWKKSQALIIKIHNHMKTKKAKNANSVAIEQVNQIPQIQPPVICTTVLREPLLESGTAELFRINSSPAPT